MEQRLLTLIESTSPDDTQALAGLEQTLSNIRRERVVLDVRVSPEFAGLGLQAVG